MHNPDAADRAAGSPPLLADYLSPEPTQRRVSGQPIFGSMDLGSRLCSFPAKALCGWERQTPGKLSGPGVSLSRMVLVVASGAAGCVAPSRTTRALHLPRMAGGEVEMPPQLVVSVIGIGGSRILRAFCCLL